MARTFAITPTAEKLKLNDAAAPCETTITVSNASSSPRRCRVVVRTTEPARPDWFPIKDEPERVLKPGETTQFTVEVKVPPGTPQGTYQFRLDALDSDNPDEFATEGPSVGVEIAGAIINPPPPPFPWWIVAVAAIVLIGGGVAVWMLLPKGAIVPKVTEMTFEDATTEIEGRKLKVDAEMQVGDAKENTVVSQDPEEGTKLKKGEAVKIVYEAPFVEIPKLVGMELPAAIDLLTQKKLAIRDITERREDPNKAGEVVVQSIPPEEKRRQGDEIDLVVEAAMVRIPDVTTMKAKDATEKLDALGLKVDLKTVDKDRSKTGTILEQKPAAPSIVQRGEEIHLTAQASAIKVPPVAHKSQQEAEKLVRDAKLKPVILPAQLFGSSFQPGSIGDTIPPFDTPVLEQDEVKLIPVGQPAVVPNVVWTTAKPLTQAQAEQQIRSAGLVPRVKMRHIKNAIHTALNGIAEQRPAGSTTVLKGSTVTLYVVVPNNTKIPIDKAEMIKGKAEILKLMSPGKN